MTVSNNGINDSQKTQGASGTGRAPADLGSNGVLRQELSPADLEARDGMVASDRDALQGSSGVRTDEIAMTPSQFWPSKLGECFSKGISQADCTPWS